MFIVIIFIRHSDHALIIPYFFTIIRFLLTFITQEKYHIIWKRLTDPHLSHIKCPGVWSRTCSYNSSIAEQLPHCIHSYLIGYVDEDSPCRLIRVTRPVLKIICLHRTVKVILSSHVNLMCLILAYINLTREVRIDNILIGFCVTF